MREGLKAVPIVFLAAILQGSWFASLAIGHGAANLMLVTIVSLALLRGSTFGALAGFATGIIYDISIFGYLGLTSLLLLLAGFWTGRYGETTGRDRAHAPYLAIAVITICYELGALVIRFLLGEPAPAEKLIFSALPGELLLNLLLTAPVYLLCRRIIRKKTDERQAVEVRLIA